jgi:hypothetical protein
MPMRIESDLHAAFALLERQGDEYLAAFAGGTDEPAVEIVVEPAPPQRRRARTILPILAGAAAVATALGVISVGGGGSARQGPGGAATPVCVTALPPAWQAALSARTVTVDGTGATGEAVGTDGTVVLSWLGTDGMWRVGTVAPGATNVHQVYRQPTPGRVWGFAADSHFAVVTVGRSKGRVDEFVLVDLATGDTTNPLADAPPGATPSDPKEPTLQDGTLYWLGDAEHADTLYSYDISARSYDSTQIDLADFHWTPLGFVWSDGSIPAAGLPSIRPPLSDRGISVAHDGSTLAWSYYDDAATVHWSEQSGTTRDLDQHVMQFLTVDAVAGPYVFLNSGEGSDTDQVTGDVQILDTRTGAMADTGLRYWEADHSADGVVTLSPRIGDTVRILDTNNLPGLHC